MIITPEHVRMLRQATDEYDRNWQRIVDEELLAKSEGRPERTEPVPVPPFIRAWFLGEPPDEPIADILRRQCFTYNVLSFSCGHRVVECGHMLPYEDAVHTISIELLRRAHPELTLERAGYGAHAVTHALGWLAKCLRELSRCPVDDCWKHLEIRLTEECGKNTNAS